MSLVSQFLDPAELSKLSDAQVNVLNDHFDGVLMKELMTNPDLKQKLQNALHPVMKSMTGGK